MATNVSTIGGSSPDYTTIAAWESATDNDLVTAGDIERGDCRNVEFDETVTIAGATTNASNYRILQGESGARHDSSRGSGARIIPSSSGSNVVSIDEDYFRLRYLELSNDGTWSGERTIHIVNGRPGIHLHGLFIYDTISGFQDIHWFQDSSSANGELSNVICVNSNSKCFQIEAGAANVRINMYHCVGCNPANNSHGAQIAAYGAASARLFCRNSYMFGAGGTGQDWNDTELASAVIDRAYCASDDATADDQGGSGNLINRTPSDDVLVATAGSENVKLKATSGLIDAGTDLGAGVWDTDAIGVTHGKGSGWDIGALEYDHFIAASSSLSVTVPSAVLTTEITMAASASLAITTSATLTTEITMAASASLAVTTSATLTTEITMAASASLAVTTSAALTTEITMAASTSLAVTTSATLTTEITMAASTTLAITTSADLTVAGAEFDASVSLAVTTSAALTTEITMAGSAALSVTTSAALTTEITMAASATLSMTTTADLTTEITMAASVSLAITVGANLVVEALGEFICTITVLPQLIGTLDIMNQLRGTVDSPVQLEGVLDLLEDT